MKFGLEAQDYDLIRKLAVDPLLQAGAKVFCFGSRSRGDHGPYSDLDLMVESPDDLRPLLGDISEALSNSNLPITVDLVLFDDFAESYRSNYLNEKQRF